jgi:hypothetical protein
MTFADGFSSLVRFSFNNLTLQQFIIHNCLQAGGFAEGRLVTLEILGFDGELAAF